MRHITFRAVFVLLLLFGIAASASAQLPFIRLHSIFPAGAEAGTEIDVRVSGTDLDEASELRFSNPAIVAKQKIDADGKPVANQFALNIPADIVPGTYAVRAIGLFGISNPRLFDVNDLPETISPSGNHSFETASEIQLNTIINGHCDSRAEDHFKFKVKKDQRVIINCRAQRIDSMLDATLSLYNQSGQRIAYSRDANRLDPLIDVTAATDATYIVKLHDFTFGGGSNHFYRLSISDRPFIDYIFPPVAQAGTNAAITLYGRNLPNSELTDQLVNGQPLEKLEVKVDVSADSDETEKLPPEVFVQSREAFLDAFLYRFKSPAGTSNAKLVYFADTPVIIESEPNNEVNNPQFIKVPCEFAGRFNQLGDHDFLRFTAKKDEAFTIHLMSDRLGVPADPCLLVQKIDDKGNASDIAFVEDDPANSGNTAYPIDSHDPTYNFKAPADGRYQLVIRNHYTDSQADPRSIYRLAIRHAKPDFRLIVSSSDEQHPINGNMIMISTPLLRKSDMQALRVTALRDDGFNEPIKLSINGLPENVAAQPATIAAGKNNTDILLLSNEQVADWSGTIQVVGRSTIDGESVQRTARPATVIWDTPDRNNNPVYSRLAHDFALAVTSKGSAPATIQIGDKQTYKSAHDGKIEIPVKLKHLETIKGDVQLGVVNLPGKHEQIKFEAKDKWSDKTFKIEIATAQVPPGTHTFHIAGNVKISYRSNVPAADVAAAVVTKLKDEINQLEAAVKAKDESAPAKLESAKVKLASAETLSKQAADRAAPRDLDIRIRSLPITLTVAAPPDAATK